MNNQMMSMPFLVPGLATGSGHGMGGHVLGGQVMGGGAQSGQLLQQQLLGMSGGAGQVLMPVFQQGSQIRMPGGQMGGGQVAQQGVANQGSQGLPSMWGNMSGMGGQMLFLNRGQGGH